MQSSSSRFDKQTDKIGKVIPKEFFNHPKIIDRFMEGIEEDESTPQRIIDATGSKCWIKPNIAVTDAGYYRQSFNVPINDLQGVNPNNRKMPLYLHRLSYSMHSGLEIPDKHLDENGNQIDYVIDHIHGCRCCNPDHIQLTTRTENSILATKEINGNDYRLNRIEQSYKQFQIEQAKSKNYLNSLSVKNMTKLFDDAAKKPKIKVLEWFEDL